MPDAITIIKIAKKCEVSADWLLGLDDFPTVQQKKEANDLFDHLMELMDICAGCSAINYPVDFNQKIAASFAVVRCLIFLAFIYSFDK